MKHPTGIPDALKNSAKKRKGYKRYDKNTIRLLRQHLNTTLKVLILLDKKDIELFNLQ